MRRWQASDRFRDADGTSGVFGFDFWSAADSRPGRHYDTNFKMNPHWGRRATAEAIVEGLADGTNRDSLQRSCAALQLRERGWSFDYAPFGITGLETELALSLDAALSHPATWTGRG